MKETPQQYIARILAFSDDKDPMMVLSTTAARLRTWLDTAPAERWRERPAEDRWSAAEILAHLADAELVTGWRLRSILAEDGVALQAFDQDVWADAFRYREVDLQEALQTFTALRSSLMTLLRRVDPARLEHHGMHVERGQETIAHLMRFYAGHDLNHLAQIEGLLGRGPQ